MMAGGLTRRKLHWLLLASAIWAGCSVNPATGKRELILISRDQEIAIGNEAAPEFEKEFGGPVRNDELQAYVGAVGAKVAEASDRPMPYEFRLVASDVPNAFALPGGKVFLTAGLMSRMANERQLAAVLGHEVGHVAALHNVKGMQRQMGAQTLVMIAGHLAGEDKETIAKDVASVVANMATLKYSRGDEYQADQLGIKYMTKAGYNPHGMVELLTVLKGLSESEGSWLEEMFQTHPLTPKRISDASKIIEAEHPGYSASAADPNADRFLQMRKLLFQAVPGLK